MKKIGIIAVSAITLCWAMYEVSSDNTSTRPLNEANRKVASKSSSSSVKNEKLAPQMLLAQTNSLNSAPVCQYNFDATQQDYDVWSNENPGYVPLSIFPSITGQKFSLKVEPRPESEYGYIDYVARSKASLNSSNDIGDLTIPHTGIIAFEMEFKIPTITLVNSGFENNAYMSSIYFTGVTNNGYSVRSSYGFEMGTYDPDFGENPPRLSYSVAYRVSDNSGPDHSYYKSQNMTNNTQEYQRLGIYINQNTRQVGFIFNGVDQGYQSSLPAPLENISFSVASSISVYSNQLFGQELFNELITDRNALQFNYPQGTTDMCGNAI
ncbi:DUF4882 family protein [Acinetobacter oleivorans]|uniref:DUF4882 domain-containing protein n=1 Tax=Acinetobacter oleivorans (strain JCM 16667 / KCTC 23045 / DR1) TaxID=436717 RepID=A0AAN0P8M4_ACISD|nr:DUF4882 family protein [Acinetobacter oleivorans]ADI90846.1 hypothetical protein AOLE_09785 [Acinetobacter oleivorans DR1]ESK45598.1 hypothetical protein P254_01209 [Acinetobacter oleivorans CIP 110421]MBJ9419926.1 DUF4882 family protein [Acinetobacter oleivorans]WQF74724.1 DUF4882 domain-containing protein [Acinetobacter oleivorans]